MSSIVYLFVVFLCYVLLTLCLCFLHFIWKAVVLDDIYEILKHTQYLDLYLFQTGAACGDTKSTSINPTSTNIQQRRPVTPARESRRETNRSCQWLRVFYCRFGPILGRCWAPLDFDLGPKIVPKSLHREFFGLLRSPRGLLVRFQVNIKSKTTFDRC